MQFCTLQFCFPAVKYVVYLLSVVEDFIMDITQIDKNFSSEPVDENGFLFRDARLEPFEIEGLPWLEENGGEYYRVPRSFTTNEVSEGVLILANHTAGVTVRFRSDSPEIMVRAEYHNIADFNHMPRTGSKGFDSYMRLPGAKEYVFSSNVRPDCSENTCAVCGLNPEKLLCDWIIDFPLYSGVKKVEIGLKSGSKIEPPAPRKIKDPILFYGSSITQGGCASRPGNCFSTLLCRKLDAPQINLGFSGNGRGEIAVANAIGKLKLSAFVLDYDHNAPTVEHLRETHEPFFKAVREAQPDLPVIMLSRCDYPNYDREKIASANERREIIRQTYRNAVDAGDRKVWFIDGECLFGRDDRDACTVDNCHPNDIGFYRMYQNILPTLKTALETEE